MPANDEKDTTVREKFIVTIISGYLSVSHGKAIYGPSVFLSPLSPTRKNRWNLN
jgi:hypothetical protein